MSTELQEYSRPLVVAVLAWGLFIMHFFYLVKNEINTKQQNKIVKLEKEVQINYNDMMEMCKFIDEYDIRAKKRETLYDLRSKQREALYTDECNELNKKVCELMNDCNILKEQIMSLTRSLQQCQSKQSHIQSKYDTLRRTASMRTATQTGVGLEASLRSTTQSPKRKKTAQSGDAQSVTASIQSIE